MKNQKAILFIIVVAQFCCTSLWFAGNAIMGDLILNFQLDAHDLGHITSVVQFGFITGTLVFAILTIADRFSPSKVFLVCALLGALFNAGVIWQQNTLISILFFRFITGFFLAGIYPVGMKIAADYYEKGLGKALGFLVGALVVGTAFPHFLKSFANVFPWKWVLLTSSGLAVFGGAIMLILVPNGPFRKQSSQLNLSAFLKVFQHREFRSAAFGYFGHMWELYAFWAFVPVMLSLYINKHPSVQFNIPFWSFLIIGIGGIACVLGGFISQSLGTKKTAFYALLLSGSCCVLSPFMFTIGSETVFIVFLLFWGMVVIADSPLFSTLVAQNASGDNKGTALTIVNCIGFSITIISIQLLNIIQSIISPENIFSILAIGPALGLIALGFKSEAKA